ncbi:MAG: hypothetical protein IPO90_04745 [Flavobacteriales bacterium]|nr:hypothetical protein [Flavobacteriales bacterium]
MINGYAKDIEGEVLSYFSVYPEHATTALLTRCTDGKKAIAWETASVPFSERESTQYFYFSWIAAHNSTTSGGDRSFDLYINDAKALTFTTHHSTKPGSWSVDTVDGVASSSSSSARPTATAMRTASRICGCRGSTSRQASRCG